jgi:hypothetical protein
VNPLIFSHFVPPLQPLGHVRIVHIGLVLQLLVVGFPQNFKRLQISIRQLSDWIKVTGRQAGDGAYLAATLFLGRHWEAGLEHLVVDVIFECDEGAFAACLAFAVRLFRSGATGSGNKNEINLESVGVVGFLHLLLVQRCGQLVKFLELDLVVQLFNQWHRHGMVPHHWAGEHSLGGSRFLLLQLKAPEALQILQILLLRLFGLLEQLLLGRYVLLDFCDLRLLALGLVPLFHPRHSFSGFGGRGLAQRNSTRVEDCERSIFTRPAATGLFGFRSWRTGLGFGG